MTSGYSLLFFHKLIEKGLGQIAAMFPTEESNEESLSSHSCFLTFASQAAAGATHYPSQAFVPQPHLGVHLHHRYEDHPNIRQQRHQRGEL